MKKIKISFIGVGFFSQISHLINYSKNPNVELFEICDLDNEMALGIKKKFNFTGKVYNDYKKMNISETDGFVIIVQRKLISNIAKFFLKKKCNIFTEKPHAYSVNEYLKNRSLQKGVWLKGYVRRCDLAVKKFKNNFNEYTKNLGKLISVNYEAKSGNSYLGSKHYISPKIKKIVSSNSSKPPTFLKEKYSNLYDVNLNAACHAIDLFDFFKITDHHQFSSVIRHNNFTSQFFSKFEKNIITSRINLIASSVVKWDEKMEFLFQNGQAVLTFNSPLYKKNSYTVKIYHGSSLKVISFKNRWSFNQQAKEFVNLIKSNEGKNKNSSDGLESIKLYENIWRNFQKSKATKYL